MRANPGFWNCSVDLPSQCDIQHVDRMLPRTWGWGHLHTKTQVQVVPWELPQWAWDFQRRLWEKAGSWGWQCWWRNFCSQADSDKFSPRGCVRNAVCSRPGTAQPVGCVPGPPGDGTGPCAGGEAGPGELLSEDDEDVRVGGRALGTPRQGSQALLCVCVLIQHSTDWGPVWNWACQGPGGETWRALSQGVRSWPGCYKPPCSVSPGEGALQDSERVAKRVAGGAQSTSRRRNIKMGGTCPLHIGQQSGSNPCPPRPARLQEEGGPL